MSNNNNKSNLGLTELLATGNTQLIDLIDLTKDDDDNKKPKATMVDEEPVVVPQVDLDADIEGDPKPLERVRFTVKNGKTIPYTPATTKAYKKEVVAALKKKITNKGKLVFEKGTAVEVLVHFYFRRPDSHFKKGKEGRAALDAPLHIKSKFMGGPPAVLLGRKKDVDNLAKLILDCANGVVCDDDIQVVKLVAIKSFDSCGECEGRTSVRFRKFSGEHYGY